MKRIQIAPRGPEFSRMVYGTWRILDTKPTTQEINRRLHAHYNATGASLIKSLEKSLRFLGTDHVELFLVHRPDWLTRADDTAAGLNELLSAGKIRSAGVSNYSASQFELLNAHMEQPLVTNQIEFHLLRREPISDGTLHQCEKLDVRPMAWSPLAGGRIFDSTNPAAKCLAEAAKSMAARYNGASLEQLAYAWILAQPSHPLPVIGTNKIDRLESAAQAEAIVLEREDWFALWVAAQGCGIP